MMNPQPQSKLTHYQTLGLLLTLYFAQGLPAGFVTQALPAILRNYHASLEMIGWSGLVLLPWGLKFLWSPFVDSHYSAKVGRSRSWILPLQLGSVVVLVIVALFEPTNLAQPFSVLSLYVLLFILSLMGATHDIATDGLATRLIKSQSSILDSGCDPQHQQQTHRQSQGNAVQAVGYRMGLILGGGVLLMMLGKIGWQASFFAMAGLVALNTLPILRFYEPRFVHTPPVFTKAANKHPPTCQTVKTYISQHYDYFWSNKEMQAWLVVLLTFKVADGLSSGMVKPMMVDIGVKLDAIGFWVTIIGSAASLLGAGVATLLMRRLSRFTALLGFNVLQAVTTGLYGAVAWGFSEHHLQHFGWLYAVNAVEHFCASLALIAMLTTVMHYARNDNAGSDFTVQVCLLTVLSGGAHFVSGYLAKTLGYPLHFLLCMLAGLLCLLPIIYWQRTQQ